MFDDKFYQHKQGTTTGTKVAPTYANLVMGYFGNKNVSGNYE